MVRRRGACRLHLALRQLALCPGAALPKTDAILAGLIDMRLPLTFSVEDATLIAEIIRDEVQGDGTTRRRISLRVQRVRPAANCPSQRG
jgi:hypothetical protein